MIFTILRLSQKSKIPYSKLLAKANGKRKELTEVEKQALINATEQELSELINTPVRIIRENDQEWF